MRSTRAFTLVEMSIVLAIIGLLVGGVLVGRSVIAAAELRNVSREFTQFQTAIGAFREKYYALPGDMPNAVTFWGAQAGSATADGPDSSCTALSNIFSTTPATGIATCNGDGNGLVANTVGSATLATTSLPPAQELFRVWQHLANAGVISGSYNGVPRVGGASQLDNDPGVNSPLSKFNKGTWSFLGMGFYGDTARFTASYGNALIFGGARSGWLNDGPIMKGEDAYNIDMKLDDGNPGTGNIVAYKNAYVPVTNCVLASNDRYNLARTDLACSLIFITGF